MTKKASGQDTNSPSLSRNGCRTRHAGMKRKREERETETEREEERDASSSRSTLNDQQLDCTTTFIIIASRSCLYRPYGHMMTDAFSRGNVSYIDEDYDQALQHYDDALKASPRDAVILSCRAAAYIKKKKYIKALEDANNAISADPKHEMSYFRKGLAAFELEEYETAKTSFHQGLELRSQVTNKDLTTYQRWIRKCDSELTCMYLSASYVCYSSCLVTLCCAISRSRI